MWLYPGPNGPGYSVVGRAALRGDGEHVDVAVAVPPAPAVGAGRASDHLLDVPGLALRTLADDHLGLAAAVARADETDDIGRERHHRGLQGAPP